MAKGLTIKVEGLAELKKKFRELPQNVIAEVDTLLSVASDEFNEGAIEDAPRDEGILIQGISNKKNGVMDYENVSTAPYSAYVEFGTRRRVQVPDDLRAYAAQFKGKGGGSGEGFLQHIMDWVKRKGIRFDSASTYKTGKKKGQTKKLTIEQTAYIIYHHLMLNGVRPHPFFFTQRAKVMENIKQNIKPAIQKALNKG